MKHTRTNHWRNTLVVLPLLALVVGMPGCQRWAREQRELNSPERLARTLAEFINVDEAIASDLTSDVHAPWARAAWNSAAIMPEARIAAIVEANVDRYEFVEAHTDANNQRHVTYRLRRKRLTIELEFPVGLAEQPSGHTPTQGRELTVTVREGTRGDD